MEEDVYEANAAELYAAITGESDPEGPPSDGGTPAFQVR